jgi:hypothetical protein
MDHKTIWLFSRSPTEIFPPTSIRIRLVIGYPCINDEANNEANKRLCFIVCSMIASDAIGRGTAFMFAFNQPDIKGVDFGFITDFHRVLLLKEKRINGNNDRFCCRFFNGRGNLVDLHYCKFTCLFSFRSVLLNGCEH